MNFRALLRRAFPYIVIGIGGFALAYVVIFVFVLPSKIVPSAPQPYVPDSSHILRPIDTGVTSAPPLPEEPPPVTARIVQPAVDTTPILAPDLVGMSLPDARGVLDGFRLRVVVTRDTSSFQPPNTVLRQFPAADSLVKVGGTVAVTVSYFPPDSTSDTMRVRRGTALPRIRPGSDTLHPPDTLHPK
ncbi:MAG TPA: PASTA domain-containing protein [Gemmatimonadaceae bacterium]